MPNGTNDFVRDMTQGGAAFSFAEIGAPFGNVGKYAGMAGDMLFRMMYPNHMLMRANQGTSFDRMRSANNMMMQARLQEQFSRIHTDQMRAMLTQMGMGPTTSSLVATGANFLGMRPPGAMTGVGISAMMDLAADPRNNYMLTRSGVESTAKAFESYYNFDYRARGIQAAGENTERRSAMIAVEKARYLRRTGGLGRDDVARGLVALKRVGLMDSRMSDWQQEDGQWVDRGYRGRAERALNASLGDVEAGTLERIGVTDVKGFQNAVSQVKRENPRMTETEAREEALSRMGVTAKKSYADAQRELIMERGGDLINQYGRAAVLGGERSLARAMQFKEGQSGPMFQAFKAMRDVGFTGELTDLIEGLGEQFGTTQALNPNFIKSMAADMRAVREATGMAFEEVASYMQLVAQMPGAKGVSGRGVVAAATDAAVMFQEGTTGPMSRSARMFFQAQTAAGMLAIEGSPFAGLQKYLRLGGGQEGDLALLNEVEAIKDPGARTAAIDALVRQGRYGGRQLSTDARRIMRGLRVGGRQGEAVQRALQEMEGTFDAKYADVNNQYQQLLAKGEDRSPDENADFERLKAQRTEMLSTQRRMSGAADSAYVQAMAGINKQTAGRLAAAFGDERVGMAAAGLMLLRENEGGPALTLQEMRNGLGAMGMALPENMTAEQFAAIRANLSALSGRQKAGIIQAGMAARYGKGRAQARLMATASSRMFASRVQAAEALTTADDATKERILGNLEMSSKGLAGTLEVMGLSLTPTGAVAGEVSAELREVLGTGPMSQEGWDKLTGVAGEIMGLAGAYAVEEGALTRGKAAFTDKLAEINKKRTEAGLEALKNDPQTLKRLQAKTKGKGGALHETEREFLQAYAEFIPTAAGTKRDEALAKLEKYAKSQLGDKGAAKVMEWAKQQSEAIAKGLEGMDLKEEEEKARKGADTEGIKLSGSVKLVVEDDALKLLWDMANGERKKPKKGGTGD